MRTLVSQPGGTSPPADIPAREDCRVEAFRRWLDAVDRLDRSATHDAVLKLRAVGISVCPCGSGPRGKN
jgi:hypothetical protein